MKYSPTPIICALICLLPALLTSQVAQGQNQKLITDSSLRALQSNSGRSMSVSPLLRISNIGSSGQDGVSIELNDLTLMNHGPSLLFDFSALGSTSGNSMRIQPNSGKSFIKVSNIGSSGQDGVSLRVNSQCCLDSFFDVFYNLKTGTETHKYGITGDPDFDLLRITTYDRASPKLSEKIMSGNPVFAPSFFDITYDIPVGIIGTGFGNTPNNLCTAIQYDKATPKLSQRISSDAPAAHGFFDISYDLNLGRETHIHGDPDFDLLVVRDYNKNNGRLKDSVYSHNLALNNSFFDISFDLALGTETHTHGDPDFDLLRVTTYDKTTPKLEEKIYSRILEDEGIYFYTQNLHTGEQIYQYRESDFDFFTTRKFDVTTPKLEEKISCTNPLGHGFFDIFYDLNSARETRKFNGPLKALSLSRTYDVDIPKLTERFASDVVGDGFADIITNLSESSETHVSGDAVSNMQVIRTYNRSLHALSDKIMDSSLAPESFFDITYDLAAKQHKIRMEDLIVTSWFSSSTPKYGQKITSSLLPYIDNFFDISYDLNARQYKVQFEDILVTSTYTSPTPKFEQKISSSLLPYIESFFDITYDISNVSLQKQSTRASAAGGMMPLEMRYEYDALSRKIREVSTDLQTPTASLTLERRLSPSGSSLFVSDKLEVQGTLSTPGAGPLTIADNVLINGASHQIIGNTQVIGNLTVNGMFSSTNKFFKIDHPLDPDHKYLIHSCVESPDMMNVYNGNAVTDKLGYVTITLPDYFEALNTDFRYQLTCMGQFAQAIIAEKIRDNKFVIRTDKPNVEVSWQVTGIRNDPASNRKTYVVEVEKEPEMQGKRLYH